MAGDRLNHVVVNARLAIALQVVRSKATARQDAAHQLAYQLA